MARKAQLAMKTRRWWRRWPTYVGAIVLAAGAGIGLWLGTKSSGPDYSFATASTGTVEQTESASGTIEAVNQANVNFQVSGQVAEVGVAVGQQVTAGQAMAQLATASLQATVAEATATLAADQAKLASDQSASSSTSDPSPSASSGTLSSSSTSSGAATSSAPEIDSDEAAVAAAESQLDSAQTELADATLVAPISGTVVAMNLSVGQSVSGGASGSGSASTSSAASSTTSSSDASSSSTAEIQIQDMSSYEVQASVSASDVGQVKVGDQVDITPSSSSSTVFGTVSSIALVPTVTSGVATFPIVISVTGDPAGLYSGVSANVSIIVLEQADVLTVPTSAVHTDGGSSFVYELAGGEEVTHPVSVGAIGSTLTQITSGLKSGDRVVLAKRSASIPASGTTSEGGFARFGGGGGLTGGGFGGGGGFSGGGFTRTGGASGG
jgi:membrane fusion protein, macrolide-specific efflux system